LGLERTQTSTLYIRLLKRFLDSQTPFIQECKNYLEESDYVGATRHAHTLKGVAGTLGMTALEASCATLEKACEAASSGISPILLKVESDLTLVITALQQWIDTTENGEQHVESIATPVSKMDTVIFQQKLDRLHVYLDNNEAEALTVAQELLPHITESKSHKVMIKLIAALNLYDFDQAIKHYDKLKTYLESPEQ
jgi:HPt (histidine-containing phosphotransfer) domain-containing protein